MRGSWRGLLAPPVATASPAGLGHLVGMLGVVEDAQVAIAQPGRAARPTVGQAGGAAEGAHRAPPSPAAAEAGSLPGSPRLKAAQTTATCSTRSERSENSKAPTESASEAAPRCSSDALICLGLRGVRRKLLRLDDRAN